MHELVAACLSARGGWGCQIALHALCLVGAQVRGDAWLGLFDVDEFIFAPAPAARCFYGGRPAGEEPGAAAATGVDALRGRAEARAAECAVPLRAAPLRAGRTLAAALRALPRVWASVFVRGAAFGPLPARRARGALVTGAHARAAKYDAWGLQVGDAAGGARGWACPEWFCGMAAPQKSLLRVRGAPVAGLRVHAHDVGLQRLVLNAPGAPLKLNHYAADSLADAADKARSRDAYAAVAENRGGLADYLNAWPDESARALLAVTQHCVQEKHWDDAACAPSDADAWV